MLSFTMAMAPGVSYALNFERMYYLLFPQNSLMATFYAWKFGK